MDPQTFSTKNHRVTRIIEFHNNLCEKESRFQENDEQLPALRLKISRIRELIAILSLYEDKIKYLSVDSNRIIPCSEDDRERIKFTDCKIQLVVQIRRQNFWSRTKASGMHSGGRPSQTDAGTSIQHLHHSHPPHHPPHHDHHHHHQHHQSGQASLPAVNVEFRLNDPYPRVHNPDSLFVQITKVVNFSAVKQAALEELLRQQTKHEAGPEMLYGLIWSVTYFLHVLDSFDDNDAILHCADSAQLISQLVSVHPRHLTSPALLDNVLEARQQAAMDTKRRRKLAHSQLDHFQPDPSIFDVRSQTFLVSADDLIPSILERELAEQLFQKMTYFQFKDKYTQLNRRMTLRMESEITHCFYIKKLCFVRHRQDYAAFEPDSGLVYHFLRVAFELKPLISDAPQMPEMVEQMCKAILDNELLQKLDKVLKLELNRGCQFIEPVHFRFEFNQSRAEFYLVNEAFPVSSEDYCSLEALSKTIGYHETGLLLDLRYRLLERILIGFGHLHKAQFGHGCFEPKKMFVSLSGAVKIYDVFLEAAALQLIPFVIDSDESSPSKIQRTILQSLSRDDCFNVGALVIALWTNCNFEAISSFLPDTHVNGILAKTEEALASLASSNVAHFAKECFKIYHRQSELQLQSLLNHVFVLEWQKRNILDHKKMIKLDHAGGDSTAKCSNENKEESIPSSYDRSQREFFPVMSLGKGAFGSVFMVRNNIDGTEYALKCVHLRDTPTARNNLLREVNHLARLVHPNVVRYYASWFEYDSGHWKYLKCVDDGDELNLEEYDSEYDYDEDEEQTEGQFEDIPESEHDDEDDDFMIEFRTDSPENSSFDTKNTTGSFSRERKKSVIRTGTKYEKSEQEKKGLRLMLCIQMELCDRCTLHDKIREGTLLEDPGGRYRILKEMLSALAYIHSMDIIHRDLKPSNIFFVNGRVKIGDFGLARRSKQDPNSSVVDGGAFRKVSTTAFGSIKRMKKMSINFSSSANTLHIGTAQYMAPEVTLDAHYNQKIDLFSLGVIFFEMFYPMATMSERARLLMGIRPTKTAPSVFPDDMDKYFRPVEIANLKRLLSANPAERPTAVELLNSSIFVLEDSKHQIESQQKQSEELAFKESSHLSLPLLTFILNRLLENSTSPQFTFVVRRLMDRSMPLIQSISYDYEGDHSTQPEEDLRRIVSFNQIKLHFEGLSSSFGALKLGNVSTLLPDSNVREDAFKVCDENGVLCDLPYDRRMLLSRYLAFNAQSLDFMICSNFSLIFRKAIHGSFHPRQVWTASFDQIWCRSWSEHSVLPFCELLTLSTRLLGPILHRGQLIYHFTSLELLKSICDHLKVPAQLWLSLIKLLKDNDERVLGQSVDELKLAFQLIFESAGFHERVHRFLFSLLKISTTNPGDLLKNIQAKCQEFDVPEFQDLIQNISHAVNHLERIVNLYYISSSVYVHQQAHTRISFRFGLAMLAKTSVEYESLSIHVVYEDLQCDRRTLLAIGGRFDCAIETQENMLQQIMPADLQEAITYGTDGSSSGSHKASQDPTKVKRQASKHLDLVGDISRPSDSPSKVSRISTPRQHTDKRMALGLTFSIEKLSKLEWNLDHLVRSPEKFCRRNDNYLIDVLIVTTMPTIDTCKIVQDLRTYDLRVQTLPELFAVTEKEQFSGLFTVHANVKAFASAKDGEADCPKESIPESTQSSFINVGASANLRRDNIEFGRLRNVIRYVINCKIHFMLLIDSFKSPDLGVMDQNTHYSLLEHSNGALSLYRFYENSSKACRFIRGDLAAPTTLLMERKVQRAAQRLRQRLRKLKTQEDSERLHPNEGQLLDENMSPENMIEEGSICFPKSKQSKESLLRSASEIGGDKLDIDSDKATRLDPVPDKSLKARTRSQTKKSSRREDTKEIASRKERAKENRRVVKRTMSETQLRRSRSGSTVSADHTPEMIDVGFVTGSKLDRQQVTSQVNEFISSKLHYLLNAEEKLKVLVTNLVPFSLLRTLADTATACFSEFECSSGSHSESDNLWRTYNNCFSDLKSRNRAYSDAIEKISQKLWAWIEERLNSSYEIELEHSKEDHSLIVFMHVGEKHFRYRLVQLDFYD